MKLCGRNFLLLKKAKKNILAFTKSIVKVLFISLLAQRNETKKCAGSNAAGPLMPHKAANFIHECVR
jgi:hypothetical protein